MMNGQDSKITPQLLIDKIKKESQEKKDIPADLLPWVCKVNEFGDCAWVIDSICARVVFDSNSAGKYLRLVPVQTIIQNGYCIENSIVIMNAPVAQEHTPHKPSGFIRALACLFIAFSALYFYSFLTDLFMGEFSFLELLISLPILYIALLFSYVAFTGREPRKLFPGVGPRWYT